MSELTSKTIIVVKEINRQIGIQMFTGMKGNSGWKASQEALLSNLLLRAFLGYL